MKNQYFGDINDYRKYGILRCLAAQGLRIFVHWMLTPDDSGTDGQKTGYLSQPDKWRAYDPELFDSLRAAVRYKKCRMVDKASEYGLIPNATYLDSLIPNDKEERAIVMAQALSAAGNADIVFFDPDNGMEVKSKPCGVKGSNKYLYWSELDSCWESGHSVLVYQHFPRKNRKDYIKELCDKLAERYEPEYLAFYVTSNVLFLLAAHKEHSNAVSEASLAIKEKWRSEIKAILLEKNAIEMAISFGDEEQTPFKPMILYQEPYRNQQ